MTHSLILLLLKRSFTLFMLVEPITLLPVFMASLARLSPEHQRVFPARVAFAVTVALLGAASLGGPLLTLLNTPVAAMQVGGGILMLMLSVAMALGKETAIKGHGPAQGSSSAIVPLAVPLLAGPAAFSYVIMEGSWTTWDGALLGAIPIVSVGLLTWLIFRAAHGLGHWFNPELLNLVERLGGFLLIAMAINLMAIGMRGLFPILNS